MSYGLEVRNDSGVIQIDGETPIMGLAARGITSATTITIGGLVAPLLAISGTGWIVDVTNSGSTYTWTLVTNGLPVEYFVFDIAAGIPAAGACGLEVFDGAGQRVYSSAVKPMRIINQIILPPEADLNIGYGSRRLATIQITQPPIRRDHRFMVGAFGAGTFDEEVQESTFSPSTTRSDQAITGQVTSEMTSNDSRYNYEAGRGDPPAWYTDYAGAWNLWIIDVTGL